MCPAYPIRPDVENGLPSHGKGCPKRIGEISVQFIGNWALERNGPLGEFVVSDADVSEAGAVIYRLPAISVPRARGL